MTASRNTISHVCAACTPQTGASPVRAPKSWQIHRRSCTSRCQGPNVFQACPLTACPSTSHAHLLCRHVQVSRIQESSTDYRKFYIYNGTKIMRLRAETKCALLPSAGCFLPALAPAEPADAQAPCGRGLVLIRGLIQQGGQVGLAGGAAQGERGLGGPELRAAPRAGRARCQHQAVRKHAPQTGQCSPLPPALRDACPAFSGQRTGLRTCSTHLCGDAAMQGFPHRQDSVAWMERVQGSAGGGVSQGFPSADGRTLRLPLAGS